MVLWENTQNMRLLANESNRTDSELYGSCLVEYRVFSVKATRVSFFLTCYDVFYVIGWFPWENTQKLAFTCKQVKPGLFGALRELFG